MRGPELLQEIQHDISPPLRDIKPVLRPVGPPEAKRFACSTHRAKSSGARRCDANLDAGEHFNDGRGELRGCCGERLGTARHKCSAGTTQFVEWVNSEFAIYDKPATPFWPGGGQHAVVWIWRALPDKQRRDIIVLFDKLNNRWVMSQLSVTGGPPFYECVAVSTTSDATGSFARYAFAQPGFNDYPKLAYGRTRTTSATIIQYTGTAFLGARLCAMDGVAMRAGSTATQQCFQLGTIWCRATFGRGCTTPRPQASLPSSSASTIT